jgi:hypothetical protein
MFLILLKFHELVNYFMKKQEIRCYGNALGKKNKTFCNCVRQLHFQSIDVGKHLQLFRDLRSMLIALMARKRKCKVCNKDYNEFRNSSEYNCVASTSRWGEVRAHIPKGIKEDVFYSNIAKDLMYWFIL